MLPDRELDTVPQITYFKTVSFFLFLLFFYYLYLEASINNSCVQAFVEGLKRLENVPRDTMQKHGIGNCVTYFLAES